MAQPRFRRVGLIMQRMSPAAGAPTTLVLSGRTYTCLVGATVDIPDWDAGVAEANGWMKAAAGGVGSTTNRPTNLAMKDKGLLFHDSTLGYNIQWDGKLWRNPTSGATV